MQAVILAAGRGNRLRPITDNVPKPLIEVNGQSIVGSAIDGLLAEGITDIIFVVKYLAPKIEAFVAKKYGSGFSFVTQGSLGGTGAAILAAEPVLTGSFAMLYGDNLFSPGAVRKILHGPGDGTVGVIQSAFPERYGCVSVRSDGFVEEIVEKPTNPKSNLVVLGGYRLPLEIIEHLKKVPLSTRNEIETPDAVNTLIAAGSRFSIADITGSEDVATHDDLVRLNAKRGATGMV